MYSLSEIFGGCGIWCYVRLLMEAIVDGAALVKHVAWLIRQLQTPQRVSDLGRISEDEKNVPKIAPRCVLVICPRKSPVAF